MANSINADIRSLCRVLGLLLRTPTEAQEQPKTTIAELAVSGTSDQSNQSHSPLERIECLLEEAKQTLHKYYLNNDIIDHSNQQQQQHCEQLTLLLDCFEAKISEIKAVTLANKPNGDSLSPDSGVSIVIGPNHQLLRYGLIIALTYSVVGIYNLLIANEQYSASALVSMPETVSSTNGANECANVLSTNEESLIRLAIGHTMRIAFLPSLKCYLTQAETLFPTSRNLSSTITTTDLNEEQLSSGEIPQQQLVPVKEELFLLKPIYLLYVQMLMQSSQQPNTITFHETIRRDCYSTLIACFAIYRRHNLLNKNCPSVPQSLSSPLATFTDSTFIETELLIRKQFEQYIAVVSNQEYVIRELLLLFRCQPNKFLQTVLVNMLYKYFTQPNGLEILLRSTLDSDITSERDTTINERLLAIANMVFRLTVKDSKQYYENIIGQVVTDLLIKQEQPNTATAAKHSADIYWRSGSLILEAIAQFTEFKSLVQSILFDSLHQAFQGDSNKMIPDIETAILVIHRLLLTRVCVQDLEQFFAPMFYIRYAFEKTIIIPTIQTILDETLINSLNEIPKSFCILDDCVHLKMERWIDRFEVDLEHDRIRLSASKQISDIQVSEYDESFANFVFKQLDKMSISFCSDFFFVLLDRFISPQPQPLTGFLIIYLNEKLFGETISNSEEQSRDDLLLNNPRLIRFLSSTFQRMVDRFTNVASIQSEDDIDNAQMEENWNETLRMCIAILQNIVGKFELSKRIGPNVKRENLPDNIDSNIMQELKSCQSSLRDFLKSQNTSHLFESASERIETEDLYTKMETLLNPSTYSNNDQMSESLEECIADLRHPLMPMRGHALITIKRLIQIRDKSVEANFESLFTDLKYCLLDTESYIYLSAINALGMLALYHTDQVLPVLADQFVQSKENDTRQLSDRLKIGEVLLKLAHSIGDFAYHHSDIFIGKMLMGVKSPEPAIRISALSCLGEYCASFRFGLSKYIVELVSMIDSLSTDPSIEVKRVAVLFLSLLLQGLDSDGALQIQEHMSHIYGILKAYTTYVLKDDDGVLAKHCAIANEHLARINKQLMSQHFVRSQNNLINERNLVSLNK